MNLKTSDFDHPKHHTESSTKMTTSTSTANLLFFLLAACLRIASTHMHMPRGKEALKHLTADSPILEALSARFGKSKHEIQHLFSSEPSLVLYMEEPNLNQSDPLPMIFYVDDHLPDHSHHNDTQEPPSSGKVINDHMAEPDVSLNISLDTKVPSRTNALKLPLTPAQSHGEHRLQTAQRRLQAQLQQG